MDLKDINLVCEAMDWIDLAQVEDQWLSCVNTLMKLRDEYTAGNFLPSFTPSCILSYDQLSQLFLCWIKIVSIGTLLHGPFSHPRMIDDRI
jgi:hypothetical protein